MKDRQERKAGLTREQIAANLLAWIEDLETTTQPQTRTVLFRAVPFNDKPAGYCCLGRAAVVRGYEFTEDGEQIKTNDRSRGNYGFLTTDFGLTASEYSICYTMNDSERKTFPEIAAWLRANVLPRYAPAAAAVETPSSSTH